MLWTRGSCVLLAGEIGICRCRRDEMVSVIVGEGSVLARLGVIGPQSRGRVEDVDSYHPRGESGG